MRGSARKLSIETVLAIHEQALERFGGLPGVRDEAALESALEQPFQSFDGAELYPTIALKAACYAFSIVNNHPFADGNKRTGAAVLGTFVRLNGERFKPRAKEFERIMLDVASGACSMGQLAEWIESEIA